MDYKSFESLHFENTINCIPVERYLCTYPMHWHKYIEIAAVLPSADFNNNAIAEINQDSYPLSPGDIVFFWPGELHCVTKSKDSPVFGLQFSSLFFNDLPDFAPYLNLFKSCHVLHASEYPELTEKIMGHLRKILTSHAENVAFSGVRSVISTYEIFMLLAEHMNRTMYRHLSPKTESAVTLKKISDACTFISENCDTDLSLDTVAAYTGFSNSYFSRTFKKVTGYHFVEYVTLQRVRRAQMLLSDPSLSITDICYQSGFKSSSSFNRAFLQYKGCSPSECRRYYLEK